ncbi:sugar ABC transporter ATP-binding protein [Vibrio penaeicida]|uniref:sugar ABC transporter ATP-binding protein n=1 Tax=Vibrio penaeicida TaxID=104609 RepID=UPI000CEA322D|nr:sugar ABC transporter ATP-binding protein [Vibrio penaeicida]
MLQFVDVDKTFPGVHALKKINFEIHPGEVVGLVGENGAGKSTLMKVIYGAYQHDGGQVLIDGQPVKFENPRQAMTQGIGMVFQEQSLILNLSVMENLFLGFEDQFKTFGILNWKAMAEAARVQLKKVKLDIDPSVMTSSLSFTQRQLVELAKVLALEERVDGDLVILLDEPTSVLPRKEIELLFALVRELTSRASFVFVSHRMDEVIELSDRVYVMKDGEVVEQLTREECDIKNIQRKMVGRDVDQEYYRENKQKPYDSHTPLLKTSQLSKSQAYQDINFELHAGEVLCLVGTEGCGSEAVMRTLFGLERQDAGEVLISNAEKSADSVTQAVNAGMGYIPRERKIEGIVGGMSVFENITLPDMHHYAKSGVLDVPREREVAKKWVSALSIKTPTIDTLCSRLSGGNQQKVVLSKWRNSGAKIILLDHPTRGLDIGAKEDVYEMVRALCDDGCGVILIADTLEEAIGLSHTLLVMKDGQITQRYDSADGKPDQQALLFYMV